MTYITCYKREKKGGKNQTTIDDNMITVSRHTPLYMEDDMMTHLERRHKASFGHRVTSHAPSKRCTR
jgi:hypothetical protein